MSKIEKLAPPGYYVSLDENSGKEDFNRLTLICDDGRTFWWSEEALRASKALAESPHIGWCRLEWTHAPRRKSWQGRFVRYETFEDLVGTNPAEAASAGWQPYNNLHWNGGKPPQA